jgi:hypothetical protein
MLWKTRQSVSQSKQSSREGRNAGSTEAGKARKEEPQAGKSRKSDK